MGYQPHNPGKTNQDSFILAPNLMQLSSLHLFGVCDGHGTNGHFVSAFIKKILGLDIGVSEKECDQVCRALSKKDHPDIGGNHDVFAKINHARDLLEDYVF